MTMARGGVLVVEDDPDAREPLTELLRMEGYDVTSAADGGTALARLRTDEPYDALVVDLVLPDVDGFEVIREAHAFPASPAVLVFTGHHRDKAAAEAAGCDAFILKPDIEQLLTQLSMLIVARVGRGIPATPDPKKSA
jgi:CheY-like chemotaxis protein